MRLSPLALAATLLLCGCPGQPDPPSAGASAPAPTPASEDAPGRPKDAGPSSEAGPSEATPSESQPAATPAAEPKPAPATADASARLSPPEPAPPSETAAPEGFELRVGGVRPLDERVAVGLSGFVSLGGRDLARLAVTLGAASFEAQLPQGALLRVGAGRYEVRAFDKAKRTARLVPVVAYAGQARVALPLELAEGQRR
ncbi:MAG TPA: hypothetical protein DEA08_02285, partial [Planctomycetes bacterium]|nr:hypothetical protein [Planctomycetota bacterium]